MERTLVSQSISQSKTSHRRLRKRSLTRFSDSIARLVITAGGIGTILVAVLIVIVMFGQLLPLAQQTEVIPIQSISFADDENTNGLRPKALGIDEYGDLCWLLYENREIRIYELQSGKHLRTFFDSENGSAKVSCVSVADDNTSLLIGCDNGSVQVIVLNVSTEYRETAQVAKEASIDEDVPTARVVTKLSNGLDRIQSIEGVTYFAPEPLFKRSVDRVDWVTPESLFGLDSTKSWRWAASDGDSVVLTRILRQKRGLSQQIREDRQQWQITLEDSRLKGLMVGSQGNQVTTVDHSGLVTYWEGGKNGSLQSIATHWSISGSSSRVTTVSPLLGRNSLLIGCESGFVEVVATSRSGNRLELLSIHRFGLSRSKVEQLDSATNARMIAVGYQDGTQAVIYVPTNRLLAQWKSLLQDSLCFSANSKFLGAIRPDSFDIFRVATRFPESGWKSLMGSVWYEGYDSPRRLWQSSTGTSQGEPKFGLIPLVFGTVKGAIYSMLIAAPIGFFSALFASEYLSQTTRKRIKPAIELMSSVPSVALGYVGAVVLAPLLRDELFGVMLWLPFSMIIIYLFRILWMVVPAKLERFASQMRVVACIAAIVAGLWLSWMTAGSLESRLFGGSLTLWLGGDIGNGWIGWFFLFIPPCIACLLWISDVVPERFVNHSTRSSKKTEAMQRSFWFLTLGASTLVLAGILASSLTFLGMDPRGTVFGSYQERNALLVGIILGFAIIPMVYSLSEDALQAVPRHLRSASLSCGATSWQTTSRIVIPAAASGLFSAMMLAAGRAIGETMVVLMAAGSTPIMEWSPFSGYRSLAATLATELPEAAQGSTHYHTLFAAAAALFCLTVLVNSLAEFVRLRFRKRTNQL